MKLRFADQLRGVAALTVAVSHLVAIFWMLPGVVGAVTFSPEQPGPPPGTLLDVVNFPWFNGGPFGVAVFFLISGFVIPFSLLKHSRASFAAARLLRIYPTYLAAFLLQMAVLYGASLAWGRPFTHPPVVILTNALLIYDLVGHPSLDLVNWTLSVELKFYALAILIAPALRRGSVWALLAAAVLVLALNAGMRWGWLGDIAAPPSSPSYTASSHSLCVGYMLIGTAFNLHLRRLLSTPGLVATVFVMAALVLVSWRLSVWAGQYPVVTLNYVYALLLFAGLYAVRDRVPANPVLDGMAAISFPFYLVHSLMGYSVMRALMIGAGVGYLPALAIAVASVILLSAVLHRVIEVPAVRAGRWLAPGRLN